MLNVRSSFPLLSFTSKQYVTNCGTAYSVLSSHGQGLITAPQKTILYHGRRFNQQTWPNFEEVHQILFTRYETKLLLFPFRTVVPIFR